VNYLSTLQEVCPKTEARKDGEIDPKFWEILLSADKKDYERICAEYGVTDFRWMLKKLNEKKRERERTRASRGTVLICFVRYIFNVKCYCNDIFTHSSSKAFLTSNTSM